MYTIHPYIYTYRTYKAPYLGAAAGLGIWEGAVSGSFLHVGHGTPRWPRQRPGVQLWLRGRWPGSLVERVLRRTSSILVYKM